MFSFLRPVFQKSWVIEKVMRISPHTRNHKLYGIKVRDVVSFNSRYCINVSILGPIPVCFQAQWVREDVLFLKWWAETSIFYLAESFDIGRKIEWKQTSFPLLISGHFSQNCRSWFKADRSSTACRECGRTRPKSRLGWLWGRCCWLAALLHCYTDTDSINALASHSAPLAVLTVS